MQSPSDLAGNSKFYLGGWESAGTLWENEVLVQQKLVVQNTRHRRYSEDRVCAHILWTARLEIWNITSVILAMFDPRKRNISRYVALCLF